MCGIVGVAGNINEKEKKVFRDMLVMDQVRGFDSTGVVAVSCVKGKEPIFEKDCVTPSDLWMWGGSDIFDKKGIAKMAPKLLLGHNRAATLGKIVAANAHPFDFPGVIGVHNGTLTQYKDLDNSDKYDVDSEALLYNINKYGIKEVWPKFFGAAALVWFDKQKETVNFARNAQRPMCYAWNEKEDVMFFASEAWMITAAAGRHGVKLKLQTYEQEDDKGVKSRTSFRVASMEESYFYEFELTATNCNLKSREKLEKVIPKKVTNLTPGKVQQTGTPPVVYQSNKNSTRINQSWAKGHTRLGKEEKGRRFRLHFSVYDSALGGVGSRTIKKFVGFMIDTDEKIEVFPETVQDAHEIDKTLSGYAKPTYSLECRPRFRVKTDGAGPHNILMAGSSGVAHETKKKSDGEPQLYPIYGGRLVSRKELETYLKEKKCHCIWCSEEVKFEDYNDIRWVDSDTVECGFCLSTYSKYILH